jgi:hypothetical protein
MASLNIAGGCNSCSTIEPMYPYGAGGSSGGGSPWQQPDYMNPFQSNPFQSNASSGGYTATGSLMQQQQSWGALGERSHPQGERSHFQSSGAMPKAPQSAAAAQTAAINAATAAASAATAATKAVAAATVAASVQHKETNKKQHFIAVDSPTDNTSADNAGEMELEGFNDYYQYGMDNGKTSSRYKLICATVLFFLIIAALGLNEFAKFMINKCIQTADGSPYYYLLYCGVAITISLCLLKFYSNK